MRWQNEENDGGNSFLVRMFNGKCESSEEWGEIEKIYVRLKKRMTQMKLRLLRFFFVLKSQLEKV